MARARPAQSAGQDLSVIGDEATQRAIILVVDEVDAGLTEWTGFRWAAHGLFLVVFVILIAPRACGCELLFRELGCAQRAIVQRQEIADDAVVEAQRALILGQGLRVGV